MSVPHMMQAAMDLYDDGVGSDAAGFALSRAGGGYVDQKWRPHFGQTQN